MRIAYRAAATVSRKVTSISIHRVLAVIPVADFETACGWYEKFVGRPADTNPMDSLAEWHVADTAWIQVFHDEAKAGSTAVNFVVDELDAELTRLGDQAIMAGEPLTVSKGRQRLATITDADGNNLGLIETLKAPVSRSQAVRHLFTAFAAGDREIVEGILADDLSFSTPLDVGLDRTGYFERCWPGAGSGNQVEFMRMIEVGDEVIATYETKNPNGTKGRNTEVFTFDDGDRISKVEVYFGWTA
jgi:hypothetical protein